MSNYLNYEQIQQRFNGGATIIKVKGYSGHNPTRDYSTAKEPVDRGWTSGDRGKLTEMDAIRWGNKGGWLGLVVPHGFIVVDVDDASEGEFLRQILRKTDTRSLMIKTPNGFQFIFKDAGTVPSQSVKSLTLAGFIVDYRLAGKGYFVLPLGGSTLGREWLIVEEEIDAMPLWLIPSGKSGRDRQFSLPIDDGERNDLLFRHGCMLQARGIADTEIEQTIRFMAEYLCNPVYDEVKKLDATISQILMYQKKKKKALNGLTMELSDIILSQEEDLDEWEEPVWFDEHDLPVFPVAVFPAWIRAYVEEIATTLQVPIDAPCMAVLSVLSTALTKKFVVTIPSNGWTERINLYCQTVMPPGDKKSEILRVFASPIYEYELQEIERIKPLYEQQQMERAGNKKRLEQLGKKYAVTGDRKFLEEKIALNAAISKEKTIHMPQFVTNDCTPERLVGLIMENNERMAILSAEGGIFATMAGRYSGGIPNLDVFLMSYTGDALTVDRQGRKERLTEPALTIGLFIQPDVLAKMPEEMNARGLLARFLYSLPKSNVGHRTLKPTIINRSLKEDYDLNVKRLLGLNGTGGSLSLSEQAYLEFAAFYDRVERAMREDGELSNPDLQAWGKKLPGTMLRVAALIHVAVNCTAADIPAEITAETMKLIMHVGECFIAHTKAVFGDIGLDEHTNDAKYLLKVIKRQGNDIIPLRSIQQLTKKRWKDVSAFKRSLSILESRGYINQRKIQRKVFILVNPNVTCSNIAPITPNSNDDFYGKNEMGVMGAENKAVENAFLDDYESGDVYI